MIVFESLGPVLLLVAFGKTLSATGFFTEGFFKEVNRLTYFWGLPGLLVYRVAEIDLASEQGKGILIGLLLVVALSILLAYLALVLLRVPRFSWGAFVQGSFRGNLAFVGFPVVFFAVGQEGLDRGLFASGICIIVYNVASVALLIAHADESPSNPLTAIWRHGLRNPLILACLLGFLLNLGGVEIPTTLRRTLEALGQVALPLALIGLGSGLKLEEVRGKAGHALGATLINVAACPLLGYFIGSALGLDEVSLKVLVIFLSCPTAIFSYVLAEMLNNDALMARSIVVQSTLLSILSLSLAVAFL